MIGQGLRQLQETLNRKADAVQREFIAVGEKLQELSRKIAEPHGADREPLIAEQEALRERQRSLADEINLWRDRARRVLRQQGDAMLRAYLDELLATDDETVHSAVEHALYLFNASEEELAQLAQSQLAAKPTTPVGRLIERARTDYDLRGKDPAPRKKTASEFANRPGMAQNDEALVELEAALEEKDPLVNEVVTLTCIQMHRFRAMRLADLDAGYASVMRLTSLNHTAVIPVLIEIAETPRSGYTQGKEGNNLSSREAALARLVEWHTAEAQAAVRARQQDRDSKIARAAARALETW